MHPPGTSITQGRVLRGSLGQSKRCAGTERLAVAVLSLPLARWCLGTGSLTGTRCPRCVCWGRGHCWLRPVCSVTPVSHGWGCQSGRSHVMLSPCLMPTASWSPHHMPLCVSHPHHGLREVFLWPPQGSSGQRPRSQQAECSVRCRLCMLPPSLSVLFASMSPSIWPTPATSTHPSHLYQHLHPSSPCKQLHLSCPPQHLHTFIHSSFYPIYTNTSIHPSIHPSTPPSHLH